MLATDVSDQAPAPPSGGFSAFNSCHHLPLALPETASFDEWAEFGVLLVTARRKADWLIGDWLDYGSTRFGDDKARARANIIFRADVERFAPILDVCRGFPPDVRREGLTFGHHRAVMQRADKGLIPLPNASELLDKAERDRMTVATLKAAVRVATDRQIQMPEDDPIDPLYRCGVQCLNGLPKIVRQMVCEAFSETLYGVVTL